MLQTCFFHVPLPQLHVNMCQHYVNTDHPSCGTIKPIVHQLHAVTDPTNTLVIIVALQMHCETSGKEALKWVADGKVLPDLILLDCMMPGMSGALPQSTALHKACTYIRPHALLASHCATLRLCHAWLSMAAVNLESSAFDS